MKMKMKKKNGKKKGKNETCVSKLLIFKVTSDSVRNEAKKRKIDMCAKLVKVKR